MLSKRRGNRKTGAQSRASQAAVESPIEVVSVDRLLEFLCSRSFSSLRKRQEWKYSDWINHIMLPAVVYAYQMQIISFVCYFDV